jgi:CTP:molybdopterin cytidylyltransferase MocA
MIRRPWVILLAAGGSRRFGAAKQLARIGGRSLLRRAAECAIASRPGGCIVVLGARAARLERELQGLAVRIVRNPGWKSGMAGSLRKGIAALPAAAPAALVFLADQAALGPGDLAVLAAASRRAPRAIVTARAGGVRCPPAVIPRRLFPAVRRLRGEAGARELLRDRRRRVIEFDMPRAALDVDGPGDLGRIARSAMLS